MARGGTGVGTKTGTGSVVLSASPALTGSPTVPTQAANDNSTNIASTAYADRAGGGAFGAHSGTPTCSTNCSSILRGGVDTAFVALGSGTAFIVNFGTTWGAAPVCVATATATTGGAPVAANAVPTTSVVTVSGQSSMASIAVICAPSTFGGS